MDFNKNCVTTVDVMKKKIAQHLMSIGSIGFGCWHRCRHSLAVCSPELQAIYAYFDSRLTIEGCVIYS